MKKYHFGIFLYTIIINFIFYFRIISTWSSDSFAFISSLIICILILLTMIIYKNIYSEPKYYSTDELFLKNTINYSWRFLLYFPTFALLLIVSAYLLGSLFDKDILFNIHIIVLKLFGFDDIF